MVITDETNGLADTYRITYDLGTDTAGAWFFGEVVRPDRYTVEVQAEERNGFLLGAPLCRSFFGVSAYHAEVIGEDSGLSRRIGIQVVGDGTSGYKLERSVRVLEVQLREPVIGLILFNARGGTLRFTEVVRRRDVDSKIGTADDSVDVRSGGSGAHDGVTTLNDKNIFCSIENGPISYR